MNRNEADLVLRHYTHEYAASRAAFDDSPEDIAALTRKLSYYIGADIPRNNVRWIVHVCWEVITGNPDAESDLNFEVNAALDAANIRGPHILRYTTQETTV